jgi:hypothetical protein
MRRKVGEKKEERREYRGDRDLPPKPFCGAEEIPNWRLAINCRPPPFIASWTKIVCPLNPISGAGGTKK